MSDQMDRILDDCLTELIAGAASVEDCLSRYPEHADDLRPLLQVAVQVHALEGPEMRAVASTAAKRRMLLALSDQERHLRRVPRSLRAVASGFLSLLGEGGKRKEQRRGTLLIGAAAAIMVVMLTLVPGALVEMGRYGVVGQAAVVAEVVGMVEVQHQPVPAWRSVTSDTVLSSGYRIRTGDLSAATVRFFDGSTTILGADTELTFTELSSRRDGSGRKVILYQTQGQTQNQVQKLADAASLFEIDTPTAVAVVHGTEFQVGVAGDGATTVSVTEGTVGVTTRHGATSAGITEGTVGVTTDGTSQVLGAGQFASILPPSTEPTTVPTATFVPTPEAEPYDRSELAQVAGRAGTRSPTTTPQRTATAQVAEEPDGPEDVGKPDHPQHPEHPEHPEHPAHPAQPERSEPPEKPDRPDKPSKE